MSLLNSLICSLCCVNCEFFGIFYVDDSIFFFSKCMPFTSCLIALAMSTSSVLYRNSKKRDILPCSQFQRENVQFFLPLSMIFLSVWKFYSSYLSVLNHKKMLDFGKCFLPFFFFCIFWDDHMVFLFSLLTWGITLLISLKVKPTLHSRDKCYLVMMYYAFYIFLDLIC